MSQENVELLRALYEAFNRGDARRALRYLHPDVELHQPPELPDADSYYGIAAFQKGMGIWLEEWDSFSYEVEDVIDFGDSALMEIRLRGTAKRSGIPMEREAFHLWTLRDDRAQKCVVYFDRAEALGAAGRRR